LISKFSLAALLVILSPLLVGAQQTAPTLTPQQTEGRGVFKQRCAVCHMSVVVGIVNGQSVMVSTRMFGPTLFKDMVIGSEDSVRQQIMKGSDRMPGYQYGLKPAQITAIIEYLKTVDRKSIKGDMNAVVNAD
jgi:mono/diheme cytochrome c family protein